MIAEKRSGRSLIFTAALAAISLAATAVLFLVYVRPLSTARFTVGLVFIILLLLCAGGLPAGKRWAGNLASGTGMGFVIATLDVTLFGYGTFPPAKYLILIPALYLALLPSFGSIRVAFGLEPLRRKHLLLLYGSLIAIVLALSGGYVHLINSLFPPGIQRIRTQPYRKLYSIGKEGGDQGLTWSDDWGGFIPDNMEVFEDSGRARAWKTADGEVVRVSREITWKDFDYMFFGYPSAFRFERAVWNAGMGQPMLLPIKAAMAIETTEVFELESPTVSAVVSVTHPPDSASWRVMANIYPAGGAPLNYITVSRARQRALAPVVRTLETYRFRDPAWSWGASGQRRFTVEGRNE